MKPQSAPRRVLPGSFLIAVFAPRIIDSAHDKKTFGKHFGIIILTVTLLAVVVIPAAAQTPAPPAPQSPEAFIRFLYDREHHPTRADEEAFAGRKGGELVYSPSLLALMRKDIRDTPKGDIPKLEGDPICDCQDSAGLSISDLQTTAATPGHADVQLTLHPSGEKPRKITFHLLHIPAGWRIDDIATKDTPSLRRYLTSGSTA